MSFAWSSVKALSIPVGGTARDVKRVSVGGVTLWEKANPLPYDAEVEYLESTGTQWIDTGFAPSGGYRYEISVSHTTNDARCGCQSNTSSRTYLELRSATRFRWVIGQGGLTDVTVPSGAAVSAYVDCTALKCGIGNTELNIQGRTLATNTFLLFGSRGSISAGGYAMRIHGAKVYDSGVLVRDFIPVRVGSGANAVGCLYDRLGTGGLNPDGTARNDGLYFRQGTGAFVVGPDKN